MSKTKSSGTVGATKALGAMPVGLTTDGVAIGKMITLIIKSKAKLEAAIVNAAASCILHAIEHGNVTPLNKLAVALSDGAIRSNTFRQWCIDVGPVKWVEASTDKDGTKRPAQFGFDSEKGKTMKAEMADADKADAKYIELLTPFWTKKPEPEFKPTILPEILARVLKQAEKAAQDEEHKGQHDLRMLAGLRQLVATAA